MGYIILNSELQINFVDRHYPQVNVTGLGVWCIDNCSDNVCRGNSYWWNAIFVSNTWWRHSLMILLQKLMLLSVRGLLFPLSISKYHLRKIIPNASHTRFLVSLWPFQTTSQARASRVMALLRRLHRAIEDMNAFQMNDQYIGPCHNVSRYMWL